MVTVPLPERLEQGRERRAPRKIVDVDSRSHVGVLENFEGILPPRSHRAGQVQASDYLVCVCVGRGGHSLE